MLQNDSSDYLISTPLTQELELLHLLKVGFFHSVQVGFACPEYIFHILQEILEVGDSDGGSLFGSHARSLGSRVHAKFLIPAFCIPNRKLLLE